MLRRSSGKSTRHLHVGDIFTANSDGQPRQATKKLRFSGNLFEVIGEDAGAAVKAMAGEISTAL